MQDRELGIHIQEFGCDSFFYLSCVVVVVVVCGGGDSK